MLGLSLASVIFSSIGWYKSEHPNVAFWRSPEQETVYAKSYFNETVILDGKKTLTTCHFANVKLVYHGLSPVSFSSSDFKGEIWIGSDNIGIRNFGTMNAEVSKIGQLIQLHGWVEMDKNGSSYINSLGRWFLNGCCEVLCIRGWKSESFW